MDRTRGFFQTGVNFLITQNSLYVTYLEVPFRCTIERIGVLVQQANSGNFKMALYNSDVDDLPNELVCDTGSLAVVGNLAANDWEWFTPTTTPELAPGLYWIGIVCDTAWIDGVAGIRDRRTTSIQTTNDTSALNGIGSIYSQVAAWVLPDPMTEVFERGDSFLAHAISILM